MADNQILKYAMDDIVFENRNKTYGAYFLRRLYDKNMTRAIIIGSILALLLISMPMILKAVREMMPTDKEDLSMREITLAEPPPIDPTSHLRHLRQKWIHRRLKTKLNSFLLRL